MTPARIFEKTGKALVKYRSYEAAWKWKGDCFPEYLDVRDQISAPDIGGEKDLQHKWHEVSAGGKQSNLRVPEHNCLYRFRYRQFLSKYTEFP